MDSLKEAERQRRDEQARRSHDQRLQPRRLTPKRYGVCGRTITRWEADPHLDFPRPVEINGRKYDNLDLLDEWDQMMAERGRRNLAQYRGDE